MPKLPNEIMRVKTVTKGTVLHEASVNVDSRGWFTVSVPERMKTSAREFFDAGEYSRRGMEFCYGHGGAPGIRGQILKDCAAFVRAAIANHYAVTTITEDVLAYRYSSGLRYWRNRDGSITHNGVAADADREGRWADTDDEAEGMVICAVALVKKTHIRGKSRRVEWVLWRPDNDQDDSDVRSQLNALSPGDVPEDPESDGWTVIPYDPKAAAFFYAIIHSLCRIDSQLRSFFRDDKKVAAAITAGAPLSLLP